MIILFFIVAFIIIVGITLGPSCNRKKISEEITKNGGALHQADWQAFGNNWAFDRYSNYVVTYKDKYGNIKRATAKTMFGSGVYFGNEETLLEATDTRPSAANNETYAPTILSINDWNSVDKLQDEVRRLELENAELKKRVEELLKRG